MERKSGSRADDYGELLKIANSPDGQRLLNLVQQRGGEQFGDAMHRAEEGDYSEAKNLISQIMSNPEAQEIIRRIRGGK